jgi:hypothetical protein
MNALSRREEDTLLKTTKTRALKECDALVKGPHFPCGLLILKRTFNPAVCNPTWY